MESPTLVYQGCLSEDFIKNNSTQKDWKEAKKRHCEAISYTNFNVYKK